MSLDPDMQCQWCGSANLYEDITWDDEGKPDCADVWCLLCGRKVE